MRERDVREGGRRGGEGTVAAGEDGVLRVRRVGGGRGEMK